MLISFQIFLRIVYKPPSFPNGFPLWQKQLAYTLYLLIYVSFTLMLISGYLQAVFSATPIRFWGAPLPAWGAVDVTLAGFFGAAHGTMAFVLVGLIVAHVGIVALNIFKHPGIAARMLPIGAQEPRELAVGETKFQVASKMAQKLAKNLRIFGWIEFWLQFVLAFISALLLAFATRGVHSALAQQGLAMLFIGGATDFCFCVLWSCYPSITHPPPEKSFQDRVFILTKKTGPLFGFWV